MATTKITPKDFVEALKEWSVLDVVEAVKAIEDEFGIKAAAAVAAPAAAAAPAQAEEAPAEEQTEFTVALSGVGDSKINVIKAVREITQLGLKEAKDLVPAFGGHIGEGRLFEIHADCGPAIAEQGAALDSRLPGGEEEVIPVEDE